MDVLCRQPGTVRQTRVNASWLIRKLYINYLSVSRFIACSGIAVGKIMYTRPLQCLLSGIESPVQTRGVRDKAGGKSAQLKPLHENLGEDKRK